MRALFSLSDKRFAAQLGSALTQRLGFEIVATGGTHQLLADAGVAPLLRVEDVTGFPEALGGRVKSLHPALFAGLLARNDEELLPLNIPAIRLLACNLYDFVAAPAVDTIDIGGVALLRAAAKNYERVVVLSDPADYAWVTDALIAGSPSSSFSSASLLSISQRRALAHKAFAVTARYDAHIADWFRCQLESPSSDSVAASPDSLDSDNPFANWPQSVRLDLVQESRLRYGENPHQAAAIYRYRNQSSPFEQLGGKELSYNNILDIESAWDIVEEWDRAEYAVAVFVKHNSPCGIAALPRGAVDASQLGVEVLQRALATDSVSAFGGILATNSLVDLPLLTAIGSLFLEVIIAPDFTADALQWLADKKKNCRLLRATPRAKPSAPSFRAIRAGILAQTADRDHQSDWTTVTDVQHIEPRLLDDLKFGYRAVKYVKSNAIVLASGGATVGIGSGQPNRVTSVELALKFAGSKARGAVLASDAFFPFADSIELAARAGVAAIVQPGGSIRDAEVIAAANRARIPMIFTGARHFRH